MGFMSVRSALGAGSAFAAVVVEQDGFADAGQFVEQFADGQVQAGVVGLAAHEVGDGEGEDAVEDVDADLLVGPVVHRAENDTTWGSLSLPEAGFDLGLGAVGGHDVGDGPGVAVGEQDPFAEQAFFQRLRGRWCRWRGQAQVGGVVAGEGGGDDVADPAGFADRGDLGLDRVAGSAGLAAGQAVGSSVRRRVGLGQGLVEAAGLRGVQGRWSGSAPRGGSPRAR